MSVFVVANSPLNNTIYAGVLEKRKGRLMWKDKTDVTAEACGAVAEHALKFGAPVIVSVEGVPTWEITVRKLT